MCRHVSAWKAAWLFLLVPKAFCTYACASQPTCMSSSTFPMPRYFMFGSKGWREEIRRPIDLHGQAIQTRIRQLVLGMTSPDQASDKADRYPMAA